ncbi:MAG: cell envelope integrity protein CreD [Duncaniella sp.]|nr:cell envelope integrity protein CreD [Duncaniella sp.]
MSYGKKLLLLGLQCGALMIGALAIWIMVFSREETNRKVSREISDEWGGEVNIFGPLIYDETDSIPNVYPESLN